MKVVFRLFPRNLKKSYKLNLPVSQTIHLLRNASVQNTQRNSVIQKIIEPVKNAFSDAFFPSYLETFSFIFIFHAYTVRRQHIWLCLYNVFNRCNRIVLLLSSFTKVWKTFL